MDADEHSWLLQAHDQAAEWKRKQAELDKAPGSANLMPPANSPSTNMTDRAP